MIVVEQFSELQRVQVGIGKDGSPIYQRQIVTGQRSVEMPDVVSQEEASRQDAARTVRETRLARLAAIRGELPDLLAEAQAGNQDARTTLAARLAELRALKQETV